MRILALDPGASFGWAISYVTEVQVVWDLAPYFQPNYMVKIGDARCMCGAWQIGDVLDPRERLCLLERLIRSQRDVKLIAYEVAPGLKGRALFWHLKYLACAELASYKMNIQLDSVNASVWKKYSCANARATKDSIHEQSRERFGLPIDAPQDAADALHILNWSLQLAAVKAAVA